MKLLSPLILALIAAVCAALAIALILPRRSRWRARVLDAPGSEGEGGWLARFRLVLTVLGGAGGGTFISGSMALPVGVGLGIAVWVVIGRAEPPGVRREREQAARDLVPLVDLIAAALAAGSPPETALSVVCCALPGPAARRLSVVRAELAMGSDTERAWSAVADDEVLAPLGRAFTRANRTGAPVAATVGRLAGELAAKSRAEVEDRARVVGVKAAVPLGVCLLPSFLLIGIVPVAAGLLDSIS